MKLGKETSIGIDREFRALDKQEQYKEIVRNLLKDEIRESLWKLSYGSTYLDITRKEVEDAIFQIIDKHMKDE